MDIQIFQYKESNLEEIRIILNEYLSFIAKELTRPPWDFNLDVEKEVNFKVLDVQINRMCEQIVHEVEV